MNDPVDTGKVISTTWEVRTYDVWGNAKDGYEVNDSYRQGEVQLELKVLRYNTAFPGSEFEAAEPTDRQIAGVFGVRASSVETDGDDRTIYVNRAKDGYPIGELFCTSHESLSPIREL